MMLHSGIGVQLRINRSGGSGLVVRVEECFGPLERQKIHGTPHAEFCWLSQYLIY